MKTARQPQPRRRTRQTGSALAEAPNQLTHAQRREFRRRREKLAAFNTALSNGLTKTAAAKVAGLDPVTCWRYRRAVAQNGELALVPRYTTAGRRRAIERHRLSPAAVAAVQKLFLATGSAERAWRCFADLRICPSDLAEWIRSSENLPSYLLRAARPRRQAGTVYHGEGFSIVVTRA